MLGRVPAHAIGGKRRGAIKDIMKRTSGKRNREEKERASLPNSLFHGFFEKEGERRETAKKLSLLLKRDCERGKDSFPSLIMSHQKKDWVFFSREAWE